MKNEELKELRLYRVQTLEDYFESLAPNFERQLKDTFDTKHRYVFYIDKRSEYSDEQIHEIFTDVVGIKDAKYLHDWLLR